MTDFVPGRNDPSPVARVIAFGYSDGATDGVIQLGDGGPVYRFEMTGETHNPDGLDEREYDLRPLPADAFARLVAVVGEHVEPVWPMWVPIWKFPNAEVQAEVERLTDAIQEEAGEPEWRVITQDFVERLDAEPLLAMAHAGRLGKYGA